MTLESAGPWLHADFEVFPVAVSFSVLLASAEEASSVFLFLPISRALIALSPFPLAALQAASATLPVWPHAAAAVLVVVEADFVTATVALVVGLAISVLPEVSSSFASLESVSSSCRPVSNTALPQSPSISSSCWL